MNKEQYALICVRRQGYDQLVWQAPTLAIAAQAFLLTVALDAGTLALNAMVLAVTSCLVGLASFQLMAKHRQLDVEDAELLSNFEREHAEDGYSVVHGKRDGVNGVKRHPLVKVSAFRVWAGVLLVFVALAFIAGIAAFLRLLAS